jgi:hypothetical protein
MGVNVSEKFGKGLLPGDFMEGMTQNKEVFRKWYDAFEWKSEEDRAFFQSLSQRDDLRCLILAADWCGDVVRNVPVLFRVLEETKMPVEVMIMEQHTDLMDQFLTLGGRAIPIAIFAHKDGNVLGHWGPRPKYVQEPMAEFKKTNPDRNAPDYEEKISKVREEIRRRYGEDTEYQQWIVDEVKQLLSGV